MKRIMVSVVAFVLSIPAAVAQSDSDLEAAVSKALRAYAIRGVRVSVDNGVVTLSGSVDRCLARLDAVQMTSRIRGVRSIADKIQVTGPRVPDAQLKAHLEKFITERIRKLGGFGFGSISVKVRDGEVTLSGDAAKQLAGPAVAAAAETLGVKNLVDRVEIVPQYETGRGKWGAIPGFH